MTADRVKAVQERRRSNAAGPHNNRPSRAAVAREAVGNLADPDDEFYTGCTEDCRDDCGTDQRGQE